MRNNYKLVPVETINRAIGALERFANDSLAGRNSAQELRELLAAAPEVQVEPDVHRITASKVFGVPPEDVTESMRRSAKTINFRRIYGMSDYVMPQATPATFCEDAALSIAERTFSTEVDDQLASDIIQYAQRLHSLYAAPQPTDQQPISHDWDSQDKCRRCGDRDWYAGPICTPKQTAPDMPGLTEALRQYQHNDGSGLVFGYDKLLVDQYVTQLVEALLKARSAVATLAGIRSAGVYEGDEQHARELYALLGEIDALATYHNQGGVK